MHKNCLNKKTRYSHTPLALILFATPFLINWGSEPDKKGVKFYGKLTTQQSDKTITVDSIAVTDGRKTKSITMYEKPKDGKPDNKNFIALTVDPRTELAHSSIDLRDGMEISVPNPREIWVYKKEGSHREMQYLEVIVSENGGTPTPYLMDYETKVYCEKIEDPGSNPESSAKESEAKSESGKDGTAGQENKPKERITTEMSMSLPAIKKITVGACHSEESPCKKSSN